MPKLKCLVIMPMTEERMLNIFYNSKLIPLMNDNGYECVRCDELPPDMLIDQRIIDSIYSADIIIADLTNCRPNVLYELGIAHTIPKKVVLISQDDPPFDLKGCKIIKYNCDTFNDEEKKKCFENELKIAVKAEEIATPVTTWKPKEKVSVKNVAFEYLKNRLNKISAARIVLVDLDGTLFNSKEHRRQASLSTFNKVFPTNSEQENLELYDEIYNNHARLAGITEKNFRYDWLTREIYALAYIKRHYGDFPSSASDYQAKFSKLPGEIIKNFDEALDFFSNIEIHSSPFAGEFLESLKKLGFSLYLFTEGNKKVQEWKINQLHLSSFFEKDNFYIGWPFSTFEEVQNEYKNARLDCDRKHPECQTFCREIKDLYNEIKEKERFITTERFLEDAIKEHTEIRLSIIGDRYDIDLKPFSEIRNSVLRIAVTNSTSESYQKQTSTGIQQEKISLGNSSGFLEVAEDLWRAFALIVTPENWESLTSIKNRPKLRYSIPIDKIIDIHNKRKNVENPRCKFLNFEKEIYSWYERSLNNEGPDRVTQSMEA